jgi:hypothetical protein
MSAVNMRNVLHFGTQTKTSGHCRGLFFSKNTTKRKRLSSSGAKGSSSTNSKSMIFTWDPWQTTSANAPPCPHTKKPQKLFPYQKPIERILKHTLKTLAYLNSGAANSSTTSNARSSDFSQDCIRWMFCSMIHPPSLAALFSELIATCS